MTRFGTSHFATLAAARKYYKQTSKQIMDKIETGEISIGVPPVPDGMHLFLDTDGRYHIEEGETKP